MNRYSKADMAQFIVLTAKEQYSVSGLAGDPQAGLLKEALEVLAKQGEISLEQRNSAQEQIAKERTDTLAGRKPRKLTYQPSKAKVMQTAEWLQDVGKRLDSSPALQDAQAFLRDYWLTALARNNRHRTPSI